MAERGRINRESLRTLNGFGPRHRQRALGRLVSAKSFGDGLVRLNRGPVSRLFEPGDVDAALADGWARV